MAISIFPSTAAEFVSNNFVVDMNDSTNNTADTGGVKQAGPYSMNFSSGDSSFDVYLIDDEGNSVGYSNSTSINAGALFSTVVIFGVAQDEVISFTYQGSVNNADGEGDEPGAGAYLESISPTDLPSIDDTATVVGGNFGADTEITFESGATVLPAKSITVVSGTELLVTRPDGLVEDDAPYDLKAINTGVTPPSSIDFVLTDAVTAGSDPTWVTTSPLNPAEIGSSFTQTLEATDSDGTVVDYSVTAGTLTPGLSLNSSTGVLSGTATTAGNFTFTVTATDDGGNETAKEFEQPCGIIEITSTQSVTLGDSYTAYVFGGGGGGGSSVGSRGSGGGGGSGFFSTGSVSAGTYTATIGAGGGSSSNGGTSSISGVSASGGNAGSNGVNTGAGNGGSGGSGGGAGNGTSNTGTEYSGGAGGTNGSDGELGEIGFGTVGTGSGTTLPTTGVVSEKINTTDFYVGGPGGDIIFDGTNGVNATAFGGGGGGSNADQNFAKTLSGGSGKAGYILLVQD